MLRVVTLCCAVAIVAAPAANADEAEDRAVTFVQGFGGKVDRSAVDGPVTVVALKDAPVTDGDLKQLAPLKRGGSCRCKARA